MITTTEPRGVLTAPGPVPQSGTSAELCSTCHAAVVIDLGRVEIAHEIDCPADVIA